MGPASDVYNLGATLYHLLSGRPPFRGSLSELNQKVQEGDFPWPRVVNPNVPKPLEAICLKAMAFNPNDRYRSAHALAEDVDRWLADEPVSAYREGISAKAARWMRRHRGATRVAAVALVVVIGTTCWPLWRALSNRRWAQQNEEAAEIILKDTHEVLKKYEENPERILANFPWIEKLTRLALASSRPNENVSFRAAVDILVKQAIHDVVQRYKRHDAKEKQDLEATTLYNRTLSQMLSDIGEIELRTGNPLDAVMNLEESVTRQKRAVRLEQRNRPMIDDFLGANMRTIELYRSDLIESFSGLVAALIRLDEFGEADERFHECLIEIGHDQVKLEKFAFALEQRASEDQHNSVASRREARAEKLKALAQGPGRRSRRCIART